MTEIALRLARPRAAIRALQVLVLLAGLALVIAGAVVLRPSHAVERVRVEPAGEVGTKRGAPALAFAAQDAAVRAAVSKDAALGFERTLFISSPGGIVAAGGTR